MKMDYILSVKAALAANLSAGRVMFRPVQILALMIATFLSALPSASYAVTIDFDGLSNGEVVTNQFASQGVLISSSFGDVTIWQTSTFADTPPNVLDGGEFREVIVDFVDPSDGVTSATTDFFQMTLGDVDIPGNGMTAFDIDGIQIGQVISSCAANFNCPGSDLFETLSLSIAGMSRIVIAAGGQIVDGTAQPEATVDTFVFNDVVPAQVPEPTTLLLMGLGLAGLGFARRKKPAC